MKKVISLVIVIAVLVSAVLSLPCRAASVQYNVMDAIEYAEKHWNDGGSICAEFISHCLVSGGVNTGIVSSNDDLWKKICEVTGLSPEALTLDEKGYAIYEQNSQNLAKGDVVMQWCSTHKNVPHMLLCGGYNADGYATYYAHNGAMNNESYKLSVNLAYGHTLECKMSGQVLRLSTLDKNPMPNLPMGKVSFIDATDREYAEKAVVTQTNATIVKEVSKLSGVKVSKMGVYLYSADGNLIKKHEENAHGITDEMTGYYTIYDVNAELGVTLVPGTNYKYQVFGVFDGLEFVSDMYSFRTEGVNPQHTSTVEISVNSEGTDKWEKTVVAGQPLGSFPNPIVPAGYTFVGWFTQKTDGVEVDENTVYDGITKIYYARFEKDGEEVEKEPEKEEEKEVEKNEDKNEVGTTPQTIVIYFDANGGVCKTDKIEIRPGEKIGAFPVPVREGYIFDGWYTDENLGKKRVDTNTQMNVVYDITLFAKWKEEDETQQKEDVYVFPFEDVKTSDWYYNDVANAHKMGLINGKTQNKYASDENMTYAEAIKLAACMHQLYTTGQITLTSLSGKWYQVYVDYAKEKGIPWNCNDYNAQITRRDYVHIFYYALPEIAYKQINEITKIPDIRTTDKYANEIYTFYRAGILLGSDKAGTFNPESHIKRSEVAAILSRMMNEEARQKI